MPPRNEIEEFVRDVLKQIPPEQQNSPDITLLVFQMIESKSALLGSRYRALGGKHSSLNTQIGAAVKSLQGREDDREMPVSEDQCTLIQSYMCFKPKL